MPEGGGADPGGGGPFRSAAGNAAAAAAPSAAQLAGAGPAVTEDPHAKRPSGIEEALGSVIAERVREYRRQNGLTVGELAQRSGLSKGMLSKVENAQTSPSLATLGRLSDALSVPVTAFFRGLDEEQDVLYVQAGQGLEIQHRGTQKGHRYQLLGRMRAPHDRLEPMLVTLVERAEVFPLYQHPGTEFIYMLEGRMEYSYGNARFVLDPGDTLQFSGEVTHGPTALLQLPIRFLSIKATGPGAGDR